LTKTIKGGEFKQPHRVTFDSLYIANHSNHNVQKSIVFVANIFASLATKDLTKANYTFPRHHTSLNVDEEYKHVTVLHTEVQFDCHIGEGYLSIPFDVTSCISQFFS